MEEELITIMVECKVQKQSKWINFKDYTEPINLNNYNGGSYKNMTLHAA